MTPSKQKRTCVDTTPHRRITDMPGEMALPRQNGELVFATPWEARAFGLGGCLAGKRGL